MTQPKWLSNYLYFFFFFHIWTYYTRKCRKVSHDMPHVIYHMKKIESHDECGKLVHRPCSSCISSVQKLNKNSIEFSLSTWTWSVIKSSQAKSLYKVQALCTLHSLGEGVSESQGVLVEEASLASGVEVSCPLPVV